MDHMLADIIILCGISIVFLQYSEAEIGLHKDIYSAEEPIAPNGTIRVFKPFSVPVDNFYCNFSACVCVNENKWYSSATNSQSCINNEGICYYTIVVLI